MTEDALSKFKKFVDIVRGVPDIPQRIKPFTDPEKPQTMSNINLDQCDYDMITVDIANTFPVFAPLQKNCKEMLYINISVDARGRDDVKESEAIENMAKYMREMSWHTEQPQEPKKEETRK